MKERNAERIWNFPWRNQKRIQILVDSNLIVHSMKMVNGSNQKFKKMILRIQNMLDKTYLRPMADHSDMVQYVHREWHEEAVRLMHVARE